MEEFSKPQQAEFHPEKFVCSHQDTPRLAPLLDSQVHEAAKSVGSIEACFDAATSTRPQWKRVQPDK